LNNKERKSRFKKRVSSRFGKKRRAAGGPSVIAQKREREREREEARRTKTHMFEVEEGDTFIFQFTVSNNGLPTLGEAMELVECVPQIGFRLAYIRLMAFYMHFEKKTTHPIFMKNYLEEMSFLFDTMEKREE